MTIHRNHPGGSPDAGFTDKNFKSPILHKQNERLKNMTKPLNKGKKKSHPIHNINKEKKLEKQTNRNF